MPWSLSVEICVDPCDSGVDVLDVHRLRYLLSHLEARVAFRDPCCRFASSDQSATESQAADSDSEYDAVEKYMDLSAYEEHEVEDLDLRCYETIWDC